MIQYIPQFNDDVLSTLQIVAYLLGMYGGVYTVVLTALWLRDAAAVKRATRNPKRPPVLNTPPLPDKAPPIVDMYDNPIKAVDIDGNRKCLAVTLYDAATFNTTVVCTRDAGHPGGHYDPEYMFEWSDK